MRKISQTERGRTRKSEMRRMRQIYELCSSSRRKGNRAGEKEREREENNYSTKKYDNREREREGRGKNGGMETEKEM